jgi:hypothetical protein
MWLRDYVPAGAPTARVLTYGYHSEVVGKHTSANILSDLAKTFLTDLINIRNEIQVSQVIQEV